MHARTHPLCSATGQELADVVQRKLYPSFCSLSDQSATNFSIDCQDAEEPLEEPSVVESLAKAEDMLNSILVDRALKNLKEARARRLIPQAFIASQH